jgi:Ser/Thr protein kinase RdoA (MazF antagonist)
MATLGRWIRVFQTTNPSAGSLTTDGLRRYIDHRLEQLVRHAGRGFTQNDRTRLLRHIELLGQQIAAEELREVTVHSDMSLGNILVSGRRVVVLDFAMVRHDSTLHDVAKVFLQLDLLRVKPQISGRVIRELQEALLEGFEPSLRVDKPLFRLVMLIHRVNHLTGLTVHSAPIAEFLYNRVVCRQHRRWIAEELSRGGELSERP